MGKKQKNNLSELVTAAKSGLSQATNELYNISLEEAKKSVRKNIFNLRADDVDYESHQIVCKAICNLSKFDASKGNYIAWLASIAKNHCIDFGRKNSVKTLSIDSLFINDGDENTFSWDVPSGDQNPEEISSGIENAELIKLLLEKTDLKPEQKQAIIGYYFNNESLTELSEKLNIKRSTFNVLKMRAMEKIKLQLLKMGFDRNALL